MLLSGSLSERARSTSCSTFGTGLARMVPTAQRLQVVERVVVAGLDVVDLVGELAARHSE